MDFNKAKRTIFTDLILFLLLLLLDYISTTLGYLDGKDSYYLEWTFHGHCACGLPTPYFGP